MHTYISIHTHATIVEFPGPIIPLIASCVYRTRTRTKIQTSLFKSYIIKVRPLTRTLN